MATRYYVNGETIYASAGPEEHKPTRAAGYTDFSPYDAIKYAQYGHGAPAGFTLDHMRTLCELGKRGHFGTYRLAGGRLQYVGERYVKIGRGTWELQAAAN